MIKNSYIIAGPTASNKSDFAHQLARRINGVIINADSVQIYKNIENISASPLAKNPPSTIHHSTSIDGVLYRLFSILPLSEQLSVTDYLALARQEYNAALNSGRVPIFVGGTGFYINAIINGISPLPDVSDDVRTRAREMIRNDMDAVTKLLLDADKNWTPRDPQRTARALEVLFETGKSLAKFQSLPRTGAIEPTPYKILIAPDKNILNARIAARIPKMLTDGALAEAQGIINAGHNETRAIGATQLCQLLRNEITESECFDSWITKTNQYAKRQRTWFKTQYVPDYIIDHIPTDADIDEILKK